MKKTELIFRKVCKKLGIRPVVEYLEGKKYEHCYDSYKGRKKIFLMMTPEYGNNGDQAICYATLRYLKDYFGDYEVIQITLDNIYKYMRAVEKAYEEGDIILLQGGGNMGNLYIYIEEYRRFIMKHLSDCKIISMPTTITFTNDARGRRDLKKSRRYYNACKDLTLIVREEPSYEFAKKNFNCKVVLNPDMVLYLLGKYDIKNERRDMVFCLRHDWESANKNAYDFVRDMFEKDPTCRIFDTSVARNVYEKTREAEIIASFNELSQAGCVVTDRLHCMVFCAVTKTPCIVTTALDVKIKGTYKWIKDLAYIRMIDKLDVELVEKTAAEVMKADKSIPFDLEEKYFKTLRDRVL